MATALEIRLLGGLEITGGESDAPSMTRKARALIAYLLRQFVADSFQ